MRKIVLFGLSLVLALGVFSGLSAQTVLIDPTGDGGFETGTTFAANGWTTTGTAGNIYRLGSVTPPHAGTRCAFVSSSGTSWINNGTARYRHMYRNVTLGSSSEPVVTLSFWYKINNTTGDGDNGSRGPTAINGDGFRVYLQNTTDTAPGDNGYPPNGVQIGAWWYDGVTASPSGAIYSNGFNARDWTQMMIAIPADMIGQTKRLVFTWRNDGNWPNRAGALDNISLISKPLPDNPRFVAEWEQARGASINWDYYSTGSPQGNKFGIPDLLIQDLADSLMLFVQCAPDQQSACQSYLTNLGLTLNQHYIWVETPTDTYWIRDHGPWFIFHGDARDRARSVGLSDFFYNRDRPWDDNVSLIYSQQASYPLFRMPLVHTGGNIMTDGNGAAMSTNLVLDNNNGSYDSSIDHVVDYNYTNDQIDQIMQDYLGVEDFQIFEDPIPNDDFTIDHMDTWCKLLDVDRVIIRRVPSSHPEYTAIEAAVGLWQNKTTSYQREAAQAGNQGSPYGYKIFRVDTPNDEPYTNSFIMNSTIYVPQMSNPASATDLAALAAYQNAMPSYTIKGYYYKASDPWLSTDALHCRVNTVWNPDMIHIWHVPLWGEVPTGEDIVLPINITSTHDLLLNDTSKTYVAYRIWDSSTNTYSNWFHVPLTFVSGNDYIATIPSSAFAEGDSIFYTIRAEDEEGNEHDERLNGKHDPFWLYAVEQQTPVELSSFTATISAQNYINLTWVTQTETGVLGYYVLRNLQDDLANAVIMSELIPATNTSQQQVYSYTDSELYEDGTYYYWLQNSDLDGTVGYHGPISITYTTSGGETPGIPLETELKPIYPNPFNPRAYIPFSLKESATVSIEIYNARGQLVRHIPIGDKAAGHYRTEWDGLDDQGHACGTGVYHIRMTAGTESFFRKAVLLK